MPKIKVKNIPDATYTRICTNCIKCSRTYCFQFDTVKIPNGYVHYQKDVVELSEQDFPTNREWLESLSDDDLAAFYTQGLLIEKYSPFPININQIIGSFMASQQGIKEWLSKPCLYLMEED